MPRRFAGEYEEDMARARQRADEGQRRYDEEQDRDYAKWQREHVTAQKPFWDQEGKWEFFPLSEESGRVSGYKAALNGRFVAMIVPVRDDLVVLMTDPEGGVRAEYRRGRNIDAQDVLAAFTESQEPQHQLPEGT